MQRFFVYDLIDPRCGSIFYVGKGCGNRPSAHAVEAKAGKRSRKCQRIREILKEGCSVQIKVVARFDDENEAYSYEVERIAEIGLGNLTNVLPGGRGGMAQAVKLAELMPKTMMLGLYKVLALASRGQTVLWGGLDCTKFAKEQLGRLASRHGIPAVTERFKAVGVSLLTTNNNGL